MSQEVAVTRTEIPAPTPEKPDRVVIQVQYSQGVLPPHFVYIPKDEYSEKKEKEAIQADIKKRMAAKPSTITI